MAFCVKSVLGCIVVICAVSVFVINTVFQIPEVPKLDDTYWGPGFPKNDDTVIHSFKISLDKKVIEDLNWRLSNTRLTPPIQGVQQQYGFNTDTLKPILDYWLNEYNWTLRQDYLNQYPQYKTNIQGLDIHFIHVKPKLQQSVTVLPLLLLHGWPGTVMDLYRIIQILTLKQENYDFVFEVIAPSLPGLGFSEASSKVGLGLACMGRLFDNLMKKLNFGKYYVQGGDYGAIIAENIAVLHHESLLGLHSNMGISLTKKVY